MPVELTFQALPRQPVGVPGALHDGPAWGAFAAHEHGYTNKPFVAYHGYFRRGPVLHNVKQGNNGVGREIDILQRIT
ncbi:hypothetical protein D3C73_1503890 [compost metagenome]